MSSRKAVRYLWSSLWVLLTAMSLVEPSWAAKAEEIGFNREIQPILADRCYKCHGPDANQRKANFRLDDEKVAFSQRDDGFAIVPGKPAKSLLIQRIRSKDKNIIMPPEDSGLALTDSEKDLLELWIAQGAKWQKHWSFVKPNQAQLPKVKDKDWPSNPIDSFTLAQMEQDGFEPSPQANKETLIRRVSLDLTGLPPTIDEIEAFLADNSPEAYEKVADRLLASTAYGEHMATDWLDASRYADTNGYHIDNERFMWRWREWVINAYNENLSFDKFTVQQIAGDMLPDATLEQKIASGFNRNHGISFEGGIVDEEYRVEYVVDRVNTVSTVFLGLTMSCARCHNHKFDPISQKEFYQFFAFFNNVNEKGIDGNSGNANPLIRVPSSDQTRQLKESGERIKAIESQVNEPN
ncbi:MAG: DUF1549 domain-containing protein, partial [Planctomycetes bacterium]|nr:DUF1549 domain-containing protein [Planctomycetota bacterium]